MTVTAEFQCMAGPMDGAVVSPHELDANGRLTCGISRTKYDSLFGPAWLWQWAAQATAEFVVQYQHTHLNYLQHVGSEQVK